MSNFQRRDRQPNASGASATFPSPFHLVAMFGLVNAALIVWWWMTSDRIAVEGGVVENLQVLLLAVGTFFFAACARSEIAPVRQFVTFMCIATFYLVVRELDFRAFAGPEWMQWLSSKTPRRIGQAVILLVLLVYALVHARTLVQAVRGIRPGQFWTYVGAGLLFLAAKLTEEISKADKNPFGNFELPHGQFWEELLELNADMMLLAAALVAYGTIRTARRRR